MPVSPKQAKEHVTPEEESSYEAVVASVDEQLPKLYQGTGEVEVKIPPTLKMTSRMWAKFRDEYEKVGWRGVYIDSQKGVIHLSEYSRGGGGSCFD